MHPNNTPLVILGSARKQSVTKAFLDAVFAHTDYRLIDLLDHYIYPYDYRQQYPANDAFGKVTEAMLLHPAVVFATPVYWYAMSGLLKNLFDRFTDIVTTQKHLGRQLQGKITGMLATGTDKELPAGFEVPFERTSAYLNMHYRGCIYYSARYSADAGHLQQKIQLFLQAINAKTAP